MHSIMMSPQILMFASACMSHPAVLLCSPAAVTLQQAAGKKRSTLTCRCHATLHHLQHKQTSRPSTRLIQCLCGLLSVGCCCSRAASSSCQVQACSMIQKYLMLLLSAGSNAAVGTSSCLTSHTRTHPSRPHVTSSGGP